MLVKVNVENQQQLGATSVESTQSPQLSSLIRDLFTRCFCFMPSKSIRLTTLHIHLLHLRATIASVGNSVATSRSINNAYTACTYTLFHLKRPRENFSSHYGPSRISQAKFYPTSRLYFRSLFPQQHNTASTVPKQLQPKHPQRRNHL